MKFFGGQNSKINYGITWVLKLTDLGDRNYLHTPNIKERATSGV